MKYRIQATVSADRIGAVIQAVFEGGPKFDPELKVFPVVESAEAEAAGYAFTRKVIDRDLYKTPEPPKPKRQLSKTDGRAEIVERALKAGPKRWRELRAALRAGGLPEGSLNSLIGKWQKENKIVRSPDRLWSLSQ